MLSDDAASRDQGADPAFVVGDRCASGIGVRRPRPDGAEHTRATDLSVPPSSRSRGAHAATRKLSSGIDWRPQVSGSDRRPSIALPSEPGHERRWESATLSRARTRAFHVAGKAPRRSPATPQTRLARPTRFSPPAVPRGSDARAVSSCRPRASTWHDAEAQRECAPAPAAAQRTPIARWCAQVEREAPSS
jgi:hypothetical protein